MVANAPAQPWESGDRPSQRRSPPPRSRRAHARARPRNVVGGTRGSTSVAPRAASRSTLR
eukprot:4533935-Pyramimonas_sp.AAC.1